MIYELLAGLRQLLAPPTCAACDLALGDEEVGPGFCAGCQVLLEPAGRALSPPQASAALYLYGGPLASALQRLKYEGRTDLVRYLSPLLAAAAPHYAGRVDAVVPMPLHPRRLRSRGYNQVSLLCRGLRRDLGVPLDVRSLNRIRATAKQADLPHGARVDNVRGAFRTAHSPLPRRVLLVDDVRTSGATLAEAARTLKEAGVHEVYTLALAFAQR